MEQLGSGHEAFFYPFDGGGVVYCPMNDRLVVLNQSGKLVWELSSEGYGQDEIASIFAQHFAVSAERAFDDVGSVLAELERATSDAGGSDEEVERAAPPATGTGSIRVQPGFAARLEDCGVFAFGASRISVVSSLADVVGLFWRFRHRLVGDETGADRLEVSEADDAYRLTFRGQIVAEPTLGRVLARVGQLLLKLEHPDTELLAYCHAAAVSRAGGSILMPGSSGTGKSTLTAFLVAHGFSYLGDDIVALAEADQALHPLPSCLSIKSGAWPVLECLYPVLRDIPTVSRYGRNMRYVEPKDNYATVVNAAAPTFLVFPAYRSGEETRLSALPPLQTMVRMVGAHATLMAPASEAKLARLIRFVEETPAYDLSYSDLPEAMRAIEDLLAKRH